MKIVKSLEQSRLLIQGVSETIKLETKEQRGRFLPMLLGKLASNILRNALIGRRVIRAESFLIPPHPLTDFEIQKYHEKEPKFNGIYSRI